MRAFIHPYPPRGATPNDHALLLLLFLPSPRGGSVHWRQMDEKEEGESVRGVCVCVC